MPGCADRRIVLGIGNPDRGDDGAGRAVARRLAQSAPVGIEIAEMDGEGAGLISAFEGASAAFLVDACASGAPVGTVHRFDAAAGPLPEGLFGVSTHGFGVAEAVELARILGRLPPCCVVYAIEGICFEMGAIPSARVAAAIEDVVDRLKADLYRSTGSA